MSAARAPLHLHGFNGFCAQDDLCAAPLPPDRRRQRGVLALSLETGCGHCLARSFGISRAQDGTAWARGCSLFFAFDDPPHCTRQGAARDGV